MVYLWTQIDDEDVEVLVDLMRVPVAMAKQMLQKVFTNLCCHHQTRQTILKLLMRLLYLSMVDPDLSSPEGRSTFATVSSTCQLTVQEGIAKWQTISICYLFRQHEGQILLRDHSITCLRALDKAPA